MKTIRLLKGTDKELKSIDVIDLSIKDKPIVLASIFIDGEIQFYCKMYPHEVKQILAIQENFNLFYDNI